MTHYETLKDKFKDIESKARISAYIDGHARGYHVGEEAGYAEGYEAAPPSYLGLAILGWTWFGVMFLVVIGLKLGWL